VFYKQLDLTTYYLSC